MTLLLLFWQAVDSTIRVSEPSNIIKLFDQASGNWMQKLHSPTLGIWILLVTIEVAYVAWVITKTTQTPEQVSMEITHAVLVRAFWVTVLLQGPVWIMDIVQGFTELAFVATGQNPRTASDVFATGYQIVSTLLSTASIKGLSQDWATHVCFIVAGLFVLGAYIWITANYVKFWIETYIAVRVAFPFLGFSGSRWTQPYAERYLTLAIACGLRLLVITVIIGIGATFTTNWLSPVAAHAPYSPSGVMQALIMAGGAIIFAVLAQSTPKFTAGILSGAPALSADDIATTVTPVIQSTIAGTTVGMNASLNSGARLGAGAAKAALAPGSGSSGSFGGGGGLRNTMPPRRP